MDKFQTHINELPLQQTENDVVAIDIELFGMDKKTLHRPNSGTFASLQVCSNSNNVYVFTDTSLLNEVFHRVDPALHIFHNFKFDLTQLRRWISYPQRSNVIDTMLLERVAFGGLYDGYSLADLTRRYLNTVLEKDVRKDIINATTLTEDMIHYAAMDAWVTRANYFMQDEVIRPEDLKVWNEIDLPAFWAIMDMQPFRLNVKAWTKLAEEHAQKAKELEEQFDFNPRSPAQVLKALQSHGLPNLKSTGEPEIAKYRNKNKLVDAILTYRYHNTMADRYGCGLIEDFVEDGEYVYSDFEVTKADTGRMACVTGDTMLETTCGNFAISELDLSTHKNCAIISHKGINRKIISKTFQGIMPVWKIVACDGSTIKVTANHRFWDGKEWKYVKTLNIGDTILGTLCKSTYANTGNKRSLFWKKCSNNSKKGQTSSRSNKREIKKIFRLPQKTSNNNKKKLQISGQTKSLFFDSSRKNRMANIHNFKSSPTNNSKKCSLLPPSFSISSQTSQLIRSRMGDTKFDGQNKSWYFGRRFGLSEWTRRTILQCSLFGIYSNGKSTKINNEIKKEIFSSGEFRKIEEISYQLEKEYTRNNAIRSAFGIKYSAHSRLLLESSLNANSRFLYPRKQSNYLDRWISTRIRRSEENGREKNFDSSWIGMETYDIYNETNRDFLTRSNYFYSKRITAIEYIGKQEVWDLTVEEDQSYIANGFINHNSNSPNLQNIPNTSEYRSCWLARPGNEIIKADFQAQEPRITAHETQDKHLIQAFKDKVDIHTFVGQLIYHDKNMKKDDPRRKKAKQLNLGMTYGMTYKGLKTKINQDLPEDQYIDDDEAKELIIEYFKNFPAVSDWVDNQRKFAYKHGYVETEFGRRSWINPYSYQWSNNAINAPVQGGGADILKLGLAKFHQTCKAKNILYPMVAPVHDELVLDSPKEDRQMYLDLLQECMVGEAERIYTSVPFEVEFKIGKNWAAQDEKEE